MLACSVCNWPSGHPLWCPRNPPGTLAGPAPVREAEPLAGNRRKADDGTDGPILGHAGLGTCPSYHPTDPVLIDQRPYLEFAAKRAPAVPPESPVRDALKQAARALAFQYGGTLPEQYSEPEDVAGCKAMHAAYEALGA